LNLSNILAELRAEKQAIDEAIRALEGLSGNKQPKGRTPSKRLHWTQRPENKAKVQRALKAAMKARGVKAQ
jgi:hypothetical protein